MRTLCYSVRLESLSRISAKAFRAVAFDGSTDIIPASCIMGADDDVVKSEAWWIAAWILEKKSIQYSCKKEAWFDESGNRLPDYTVEKHKPTKIEAKDNNIITQLKK